MRWRLAWAILWFLAVFLSALSIQGSTAQGDNLLTNGGFEDADSELRPFYWVTRGGRLEVDDTLVHGGSYAGVFDTDGASSRHEVSHCVPVAASADYQFQGYVARQSEAPPSWLHLSVEWKEGNNCPLDEGALAHYDSAAILLEEAEHWYEAELALGSPSTARSALVMVEVQESGATVYLDDFAVIGPPAPSQTPTPEPSAYPSPSVSPTRTVVPHGTAAPTATTRPRTSSPSATPRVSPTASSWQWTPVPAGGTLRNGSFEGPESEGRPSHWRKYGGELTRTSAVHFEGQYAAALTSATSSTKWAHQVVTVQGGNTYVLSAYALKDDPAVAAAYLRLSWYASPDGSGQAIDSTDSAERLTDDSPEFRFLTTGAVVAPAGAASAKVRLMLDPVSEVPGVVYFDVVTFEETAPPAATIFASATPPPADDGDTFDPSLAAPGESAPAAASDAPNVSTPASGATRPRSSPTAAGVSGSATPVALGASRAPVATLTATAPTSTRAPTVVYRQRKSDLSVQEGAATGGESGGGGLSSLLLALAAGVPVLASTGVGVYYWRWRRARLR